MKTLPLFAFALASTPLLSGCNVGALARVNPNAVAIYPQSSDCKLTRGPDDTEDGSVDLDCFKFDPKNDAVTAYRMATSGTVPERTLARNRLAAALMTAADNVCTREKGSIVGREAALNFGLSSATSALSGAASIVSGDLAKSILAGGAGFANAVRGHANESFYRNQVTQAITASMDSERDRIARIIQKKHDVPADQFSADEMIRLVNEYHHACSFEHGLQLLVKAAVNQRGIDVIIAQRNSASAVSTLDQELRSVNEELKTKIGAARRTELEARRTKIEASRDALLGIGEEPAEEPARVAGAPEEDLR
jgi:hypothetical protein